MILVVAAISLATVLLAHTAPAPFVLEAFRPGRSLWHMPDDNQAVYLTYDDGPNPGATPLLLDVLRRENATATFFLIDDHVTDETAPIVRRMFDEGHTVALHSNDRWLIAESAVDLVATLTAAAERIAQLAGTAPCALFRPHAGWRSGSMYDALDRLGYRMAGWSWGLWDWNWGRSREATSLAARLGGRANAGDIIVIHDGHHRQPRADRQYAVDATALLIPALRARGFSLESLPCLQS